MLAPMKASRTFPLALSIAVLCGLGVTACGSSNTSAVVKTVTRTVTTGPTTTTGVLTTTTRTATGNITATLTTAQTGTPACNHDTLIPRYGAENGAAGTILMSFSLQNNGTAACHTYGWPGFQFTGAGQAPLPTKTTWLTSGDWGTIHPAVMTLQPGQYATFFVSFSQIGGSAGGPPDCTATNGVRIIAPDDTFEMYALIGAGLDECKDVDVSPLEFGLHTSF
jgi:hypothetical protein